MQLTEHFTLEELTSSAKAVELRIDNTPNAEMAAKLGVFACNALEPLRVRFGKPINVTSGYRCPELNTAVGGEKKSQHQYAEAGDLTPVPNTRDNRRKLYNLACTMDYDQVIYEIRKNKDGSITEWVHLSWKISGNRNMHIDNYRG